VNCASDAAAALRVRVPHPTFVWLGGIFRASINPLVTFVPCPTPQITDILVDSCLLSKLVKCAKGRLSLFDICWWAERRFSAAFPRVLCKAGGPLRSSRPPAYEKSAACWTRA